MTERFLIDKIPYTNNSEQWVRVQLSIFDILAVGANTIQVSKGSLILMTINLGQIAGSLTQTFPPTAPFTNISLEDGTIGQSFPVVFYPTWIIVPPGWSLTISVPPPSVTQRYLAEVIE